MAEYVIVRPTTTVGTIRRTYKDTRQSIFPVVQPDDSYVGLIFAKDLLDCGESEPAIDVLRVASRYSDRDIFVFDDQPLVKAKEVIRHQRSQFVPVVDHQRRYLGTIDAST